MSDIRPLQRKKIFITMGDPSGVGPEIIAKSLKGLEALRDASFTVIGDEKVILSSLDAYGPVVRDNIEILDLWEPLSGVVPGRPGDEGAKRSLAALEKAVELIKSGGELDPGALVTAPVHKGMVARVRPGFTGHTEFLQEAYGVDIVTMAFVGDNLRVVPVTRHVPLRDVPSRLTCELILNTISQVAENRGLMTGVEDPLVMVTALNPHAGEGGKIGSEEKDIIEPAVKKARMVYPRVEGPVPSDVAFHKAFGRHDVIVVSMYHDQCLGPFKMVDFSNGVNITLGLGHIRTSPDHGTAFDIAGKGIADPGSMIRAVKLALGSIGVKQ